MSFLDIATALNDKLLKELQREQATRYQAEAELAALKRARPALTIKPPNTPQNNDAHAPLQAKLDAALAELAQVRATQAWERHEWRKWKRWWKTKTGSVDAASTNPKEWAVSHLPPEPMPDQANGNKPKASPRGTVGHLKAQVQSTASVSGSSKKTAVLVDETQPQGPLVLPARSRDSKPPLARGSPTPWISRKPTPSMPHSEPRLAANPLQPTRPPPILKPDGTPSPHGDRKVSGSETESVHQSQSAGNAKGSPKPRSPSATQDALPLSSPGKRLPELDAQDSDQEPPARLIFNPAFGPPPSPVMRWNDLLELTKADKSPPKRKKRASEPGRPAKRFKAEDDPPSEEHPGQRAMRELHRQRKEAIKAHGPYNGKGAYAQPGATEPTINQAYAIDPQRNDGVTHAYNQVVRNREARKKMHAADCDCCAGYFEKAAGILSEDDEEERERKIAQKRDRISRHREVWEPAPSPPGYWDMQFPSTQQVEELNAKAREMDRQKREKIEKDIRLGKSKYRRRSK